MSKKIPTINTNQDATLNRGLSNTRTQRVSSQLLESTSLQRKTLSPTINEKSNNGFVSNTAATNLNVTTGTQRIIETTGGTVIVETDKDIYVNTVENINEQQFINNIEQSGYSGQVGEIGPSGFSGESGFSGQPGGLSGYSGLSGWSGIGSSGYSGRSGQAGASGFSGVPGAAAASGFSGRSGFSGVKGNPGESGFSGISGWSGPAGGPQGLSGFSGMIGATGTSGNSGKSGFSGISGFSGVSGYSGMGQSGYSGGSGFSGISGSSGSSGISGWSGPAGGPQGASGYSGVPGVSGVSGFSGAQGPVGSAGTSGFSGASGVSGASTSGYSGSSGLSGWSGPAGGPQGYSGYSGISGLTGNEGVSGYSGTVGPIGSSGYSGQAGNTGITGTSGFSGKSGINGSSGISGFSGESGTTGASGFSGQDGAAVYSGYSGMNGDSGISGYSGVRGDLYATSSTTSVDMSTVNLGDDIVFTVDLSLAYTVAQIVIIGSLGTPADNFKAIVNSYNSGTGDLDVNIDIINGSGTHADWQINLFGAVGAQGDSGFSGYSGAIGLQGTSGYSGTSGIDGASGISGFSGIDGATGEIGPSGYSGISGDSTSGFSGFSGISGDSTSGFSGFSGIDGASGFSGTDGSAGSPGNSGFSGFSGADGAPGASGFSGIDGTVGGTGASGFSGFSGADGSAGATGNSGFSGWSGWSGAAGGGGGSVGGTNKQVQFNDSGSFGGAACLTYDSATCAVGMNKVVVPNDTKLDVSVTITGAPAWLVLAGDQDISFQDDYFSGSVFDSLGYLYVIGSNDNYPNVAYLLKYDTTGTVVWKKQLISGAGFNYDYCDNAVLYIDATDNLYCCVSTGSVTKAINVLKIDTTGSIVWQQKIENILDNSQTFWVNSITADTSGNVILLGEFYDPITWNVMAIIKLDSTGSTILWEKDIQNNNLFPYNIITNSTGEIYASFEDWDPINSKNITTLMKFDSSGTLVWSNSLIDPTIIGTVPGHLTTDSSGNLYATGTTYYNSTYGSNQVWVIKFNSSGVIQWQTNLSDISIDTGVSGIALDALGNLYVNSAISDGYFITKLNSTGAVVWQRVFYPFGQYTSFYGWYNDVTPGISISNTSYSLVAYTYAGGYNYSEAVLISLPLNGSATGQYVWNSDQSMLWVYEESFFITNNVNFTVTPSSHTIVSSASQIITPDYSIGTSLLTTNTQIFLLPGTNIYSFDKNYFSLSDNSNSSLVLKTGTCNRLTIDSTGMTVNGGPVTVGLDSTGSLAIGTGALYCNQNNWGYGLGNVAIGCNTLYCAREDDNIAIGRYAAQCNRDACSSISIGNSAGRNQYYPDKNIAIGAGALCGQPDTCYFANCNIAIGNSALCSVSTGLKNIAIGNNSAGGYYGPYGNVVIGHGSGGMPCNNTVVGTDAARHPCIDSSVILGYRSAAGGGSGSTGCCVINTVSIGTCALFYGSTNCDAVLLGFKAGARSGIYTTIHNRSVIIGSCAGSRIRGDDNIIIGKSAADAYGTNTDTYCQNIVIGVGANSSGYIAGTGNIVFGYNSAANLKGNENIVIGNCSMPADTQSGFPTCCCLSHCNNIAIGSCSLYCMRGYVAGNNLAIGQGAGYQITTGRCNTIIGNGSAANTLTTGVNNTFLGWGADAATAGASNTITLGNASIACIRAQVTTISALSDARDKTDVEDIPLGLEFILNLRPVKFTWNMRTGEKIGIEDSGFIAQEVAEVEERYGAAYWLDMVGRENPERLELKPAKLIPILVKAVQELAERVVLLEKQK